MNVSVETHLSCSLLDLGPERSVAYQQVMNVGPQLHDLACDVQEKPVILCRNKPAHMPHDSCVGRNAKLFPNLHTSNRFFKRTQVDSAVNHLEMLVPAPIVAEEFHGGDAGRGEAVRRVPVNPRSHYTPVMSARQRVGLVVLARVAVCDADRHSFCVGPAEYGAREKMDVAMNHIVAAFAENSPEAAAELPWIRNLRTSKDFAAKSFCFVGVQTRLSSERAKVELKSVAVNVPQDVEKPRLDTAGV
jgi:hypothetical protein